MSIIARVEIFLLFGLVMIPCLYPAKQRVVMFIEIYFLNDLNIFECNFGTTYRNLMFRHISNNSSFPDEHVDI